MLRPNPEMLATTLTSIRSRDLMVPITTIAGRVSVVIPTKNSARTLHACLASVERQTHFDVELVVVDNHSSDETMSIARRVANRVLMRGPERSAQRNAGATVSTGEYLLFIDSDMVLAPTVAAEVACAFGNDQNLAALVIPERSMGEGFWAQCRAVEKELYLGDVTIEAARAYRRSSFDAAGGFDEEMHAGEDWDLSERVGEGAGSIGRIRSEILHDEGRLTLRADFQKKLYYGKTLGRYSRKHPGRILPKVLRMAFARNLTVLFRSPRHGLGLILMKLIEMVAISWGMINQSRASRRSPP